MRKLPSLPRWLVIALSIILAIAVITVVASVSIASVLSEDPGIAYDIMSDNMPQPK